MSKHTPSRCTECKWVDEADSVAGTSFKGVELCPLHKAAPSLSEFKREIETIHKHFMEGVSPHASQARIILNDIAIAIVKAKGNS